MAMILAFDTETTGLPDWHQPSDAPHQPHLVELAALLCDDAGRIVEVMAAIVRPDDWTIPDDIAEIHGITTAYALQVGTPEDVVVRRFGRMWERSTLRVAHNENFDARIIRIALKRFLSDEVADAWKAGPKACTARMATKVCAIPPTDAMLRANRKHFKTPSLEEAVRHVLGRGLTTAHSALGDVLDCKALYFALREREVAA